MFIAGDLERDQALIESVLTVMEAARVAQCASTDVGAERVRLGTIEFNGPVRPPTFSEALP